jgi:hypothetical protein
VDVVRWQEGVSQFGVAGALSFVLGSGLDVTSESSVSSLTVSSVELHAEGLHTGRKRAIRFIPAGIQERWKRTAGPGPVLVLSVSFEIIGLVMQKITPIIIWLCWPRVVSAGSP